MKLKLKRSCSTGIYMDPAHFRYFLAGRSVNVYDINTNEITHKLQGLHYINRLYISEKNNLLIVQSTVGIFSLFTLDGLAFLKTIKIKGCDNTDAKCHYNEETNSLCGIYTVKLEEYLYDIDLNSYSYKSILLPKRMNFVPENEPQNTMYTIYKHEGDTYYIFRHSYNFKHPKIIYESCYASFYLQDNRLILKEKIITTTKKKLTFIDVEESINVIEKIEKFKHGNPFLNVSNTIRYHGDLYLVCPCSIWRIDQNTDIQMIINGNPFKDWPITGLAFYDGKRYICNFDTLYIEDMN